MGMADRIKERRNIMGYTQEELGRKIGLQKSAIAKYENGRVENIKRNVITDMARILECSPCYLMGWEQESLRPEKAPKIIQYYEMLNEIGRNEAEKRVEELTHFDKYTKDYLLPNAAHERTDIDITEEMRKSDEDLLNE